MKQSEEFEDLKKTLESKSQQIQKLRTEITSYKNLINSPPLERKENYDMDSASKNPHFYQNATSEKHLSENTMKNYQQHIEDLQRKLRITTEMCAEQEMNYKNSFNDMELKFRRTLSQRDEFIKLRESESNNQQQLINHLQSALDKTEILKSDATDSVNELTENLQNAQEELEQQREELGLFKASFKNISMVLIPDLKRLSRDDDINELNVNSASKMLEKVLLLQQKEKEMLDLKLQNSDNKVLQNDKINEEKVNYERKLVEVQFEERKNVHIANIKSKDQEIQLLNSKMTTLENENVIAQQLVKQHSIALKNLTDENDEKFNRICEERNVLQNRLLEVQSEKQKYTQLVKQLKTDLETQKKNNYLHSEERTEKEENLKKEKEQLENQLKGLETNFQELKLSSNSELEALKRELLLKNSQIDEVAEKQGKLRQQLISVPSEVEEKVRREEKEKYEKEILQVNTIIEDHKSVLEKATLNIEQKNHIIENNNREIENLQSQMTSSEQQIVVLENEFKKHSNVIQQKDNRLIQLQLKLSEFDEQLKASKHHETHCSKTLEDAKTLNSDYHHRLEYSEKEKQDLIQMIEKEKHQSVILQKELDATVKTVNDKNMDIEKLRKDLKQVAHKLKVKHELIVTKEQGVKELEDNLLNLQQRQNEMDKNLQKFKMKNEMLSKELKKVKEEKVGLLKFLEEKDDVQEKEVLTLLNRFQGSQADIMKLKRILKKSTGFNAVKVASVTQNLVTKQRAEVDSLKTKMTWLKEALEVSEKTRMEMEEQTLASDESHHNLQQQLLEAEQKNHELSVNLTSCQQEIHELHRSLEQTAKKYSDVYALVEKQEKCLTDDRKQYDSKLKDIQQTFQKPNPISFISEVEEPYNITRSSTVELRNLLEDVKCLLSSTLRKNSNIKEQLSSTQVSGDNKAVTNRSQSKHSQHKHSEVVTKPDKPRNHVTIISPTTSGNNTQRLNEYLSKHSFNESTSTLSLFNFSNGAAKQNTKQNLSKVSIPSPTYPTPKEASTPNIEDDVASIYSSLDYSEDSTLISTVDSIAGSITVNTTEETKPSSGSSSVRRLQDKLSNLKQMGEDLTTNNREINNMMIKHSKKLRKLGANNQTS